MGVIKMKQNLLIILIASIFIIASVAIGTTAGITKLNTQTNEMSNQQINENFAPASMFTAIINFQLYIGDGCGCHPVEGVSISAWGLDIDDNDSAITDEDGFCSLELEINYNYRVTIEVEGYQTVMFDFLVVGDQDFTFHLQEVEESSLIGWNLVRLLAK